MDPSLVIFGIRAAVRLKREGQEAYDQYVRDRDVFFPSAMLPPYDDDIFLRDNFIGSPLIEGTGPLARYWSEAHHGPNPLVPGAKDALYLAAVDLKAREVARKGQRLPMLSTEIAAAVMVRQWSAATEPVGPIGRMVLTIADVAFEYVGANPAILGFGGNGEKLVGAIALNLADMIPNDGNHLGPQSELAERTVGIFVHAGLKAITDHPDLAIGKAQWQSLVKNTLPPIIGALPQDLSDQADWHAVAEALLGPAANAAIQTIAANPTSYFGDGFDPNQAIGALTKALLDEAGKGGLKDRFSEAGLLSLYRAAIGVAAARPDLFVGRVGGKDTPAIAVDLFSRVAATLRDAPAPFSTDMGAELAVVALDVVHDHGPALLDPTQPWESVVATLVAQVSSGMAGALRTRDTGALRQVLSPAQLIELARVFLTQAARTPRMVAGGNEELQLLVSTVCSAMAADDNLLMSPDDWLHIASVAAEEVAADPQRLLRFLPVSGTTPQTLCAALIGDVMAIAAAELNAGGRERGSVLFGATLREVMAITLRAASGSVENALRNRPALATLLQELATLARTQPGRLGSKELLFLFRQLIGRTMDAGTIQLTDALVTQILAEGVTA
jgi:hypothetical protein